MQGTGFDSVLLDFCSRIGQKIIKLSNRCRISAAPSLQRDRHVRRRLLKIEPLECRALMSANGLASLVSPIWFQDCSTADQTSHAGVATWTESSIIASDASKAVTVDGQTNVYDWIVQFNTNDLGGITQLAQTTSLLAGGGIEFQVIRGLGLEGQELVRSFGSSFDTVEQWFSHDSHVVSFEQDAVRQVQAASNDPLMSQLWAMSKIDAQDAWSLTTGATGANRVVVAVIDTGVDYTHPDLASNIWTNTGEIAGNGIDDDHDGFVDDLHGYNFVSNNGTPMDDNGHGTHVSGTIAAVGNNGVGVAGVNWSASIMPLKFLDSTGSGYLSDAVRAINYVTMERTQHGVNVRVINASWGGGGFSASMQTAIQAAGDAGIMFVAAAGNSGTNNDTSAQYPANYTSPNVISVAASDQNDKLASFSCYGATTVDLAAPGVSIYSTVPNNRYAVYSGTSMATPQVSGVAALAWAYNPNATVAEVRNAILQGVDQISSLSGKVASGGRLNAYHTLQLLGSGATPVLPTLGSLLVNPASTVTKGASVTLVAQGATSSSGISAVYFYQDTNVNGAYDSADKCVGYNNTVTNGTAQLAISTSGMTTGTSRFFARVMDKSNQWSSPLEATLTIVAADDYGNNATAAASIALNGTLAGTIETGGDQDWFKFQAVAGKKYTISTTLAGLTDSALTLYDRNGTTQLAYNDDIASNNSASRIVWTAPTSGTYYIKTTAFDTHQTGGYKLSVALQNSAPVLQAVSNQTMSYLTDKLTIPLSATDADGDSLTYSAKAYTIDPVTQLPTSTQVAANKVSLTLLGNKLTIDPAAGYIGTFYVTVTASDGTNSDAKSFKVSVANSAPAIQSLSDQILTNKAGGIAIPLSFSDLDGDRVTLSATAYTTDPLAKTPANITVPSSNVALSLSGNQLRITRAANYTGVFYVKVTASDGTNSVSKSFKVTATNSTQQSVVPSSVSSLSIDEDASQSTVFTPAASVAPMPVLQLSQNTAIRNVLSTALSNYIIYPGMQGNPLSLLRADISTQAVQTAFHESNAQGASWLSDRMGIFTNLSANPVGNSTQTLTEGINGGIRNRSGHIDNNAALLSGIADLELSKEIADSLVSSNDLSSENESFDVFFASLE
jgi:subtilisin family serine protease